MPTAVLPKHVFVAIHREKPQIQVSQVVVEAATMDAAALLARLATRSSGLTAEEAAGRLAEHGPNVLAKDQRPGMARLVWHAAINPLVLLLTVLAGISFATGDARAGFVMSLMIVLGVGLKLVQEARADGAAAKLRAMISVTATVIRDGQPLEVPVSRLVPGDVVQLAAGDMIPADMRIIVAKDLFVTRRWSAHRPVPIHRLADQRPATGQTRSARAKSTAKRCSTASRWSSMATTYCSKISRKRCIRFAASKGSRTDLPASSTRESGRISAGRRVRLSCRRSVIRRHPRPSSRWPGSQVESAG